MKLTHVDLLDTWRGGNLELGPFWRLHPADSRHFIKTVNSELNLHILMESVRRARTLLGFQQHGSVNKVSASFRLLKAVT